MRNFTLFIILLFSVFISQAQDLLMQNGTFNQCSGVLYDSGGSASNYGNDENFVLTICPDTAGQFISLNFTAFSTQANNDVLTIYDGDDTTATVLGTYSGGGAANNPGIVSASTNSATGCLTLQFVSDASAPTTGWAANISCMQACQTITSSIDSTTPAVNNAGVIEVPTGTNVAFEGSATFSDDGTGATYAWVFGDGGNANGESVNNTFNTAGSYTTTLTVTDTNPTGCSSSSQVTVVVLDPIVTINNAAYPESGFGPEQLISDVLVSGGCSGVDNFSFQVSGGASDLTTKSYGYFRRGVSNFPFREGIVLTTGRAHGGGNTVAVPANPNPSFNNGQAGDADLEAALGQTNTNDATFIKFNFVPTADNISFNFIMASEEYDGNTECSFADSFAFLLREVGTVPYTNLAVLPDGTPVSVTNINGSATCPANAAFFEGYNLPDTNYGGRTVVLTASANVNPNVTYEIKLVVADQGDSIWDSAIFLEAGSFNLGGDLGDDITIAAGTSVCAGTSVNLDTEVDPSVEHVWYYDGNVIAGETGPSIDVTQTGTYTVDVVFAATCVATDEVYVEFIPGSIVDTVNDLVECNDGSGAVVFDLTQNTNPALGTQDPTVYGVSYHNTAADATNGANAIANPATYTGTDGEIIHIRVENAATQMCPATDTFTLNFLDVVLNPAPDMEVCDDVSNDGTEPFDLETQTAAILGAQAAADFNVTYHLDFASADAGTGALTSPYDNGVNPEPIYVRIESASDATCYVASATAVFNLIVNPRAVATQPMDMVVCDDVSNDGIEVFDLTTQEAAILGGQNPANYTVSYYESQVDADTPANAIANPTTYSNTGSPQTIHVRVDDNTNPTCYGYTTFDLVVNPLPVIPALADYQGCDNDDDGDATNGLSEFDLSTIDALAINGQADVAVTYYETLADAQANPPVNAIGPIYLNTTANTQTIYVRLENTTTGCVSTIAPLNLIVNPLPAPVAPTPLEICDDDVDGFATFDLTVKDAEIIGAQVNMSVTYYETLADAEAMPPVNAIGPAYTNTVANSQVVIARLEDDLTGCFETVELTLIVYALPVIPTITDYEQCDVNNTGDEQESFDLTTKDAEIANGQLDVTVSYHLTQADALNGNAPLASPYLNVTNPQTIYVRVENTTTGCVGVSDFDLIVNPLPVPVVPTPLEVCDDNVPDGITAIDLTIKNNEISGNNPNYAVTYYATQADADNEVNPLAIPYTNTTNPEVVFVRVEDVNTGCHGTTTLTLQVEQAPVACTPTPLEYCDPDSDGFGVFTLTDADVEVACGVTAGLVITYHETMADADNNVNALTSPYNNIVVDSQTIYVRIESSTIATDCASFVELQLNVNPTPQITDPTPLEVCDDDADGFASFDLPTKEPEILNALDGDPTNDLDPTQYMVTYYETEANALAPTNAIATPNAYVNIVANLQTIWIRVEDNVNGCATIRPMDLIVNPLPVLVQPDPLSLCDYDNPGDEMEAFTLEDANAQILNGQTGISLTYYDTQANADAGGTTGQLTSPYVNVTNAQTIYVRAVIDVTGCYATITLDLRVNPIPSPVATPDPLEVCDDDNDGFASFDLDSQSLAIINGEPGIGISYHETLADAEAGINPLSSPYDNIVANNQTIYVRAENTGTVGIPATGCFTIVELELVVLPAPVVDLETNPYTICDDDGDGFAQFDFDTVMTPDILDAQDPALFTLSYHLTQANAEDGTNAIANTNNYTNVTNPQTIHIRLESVANGCVTIESFEIRVDLPPVLEANYDNELSQCDDLDADYYENNDGITSFDLTVEDIEITGAANASWIVSYYETQADAQAGTNAIADPTNYVNTATPQTLYVSVTDADTGCSSYTTVTIRVLPNPSPGPDPTDLELCDDVDIVGPNDLMETFDLTQNEAYVINGEVGVTTSYYTSQEDAITGTNAIADPTMHVNEDPANPGTAITPQTIYVRVTNGDDPTGLNGTGCYTLVDFDVIVNPLPVVTPVDDYTHCELNTDGIYEGFDFTTMTDAILNGQDPAIFTVTYHDNLASAQAGIDDLSVAGLYTNTSNPQTIYVNITNTVTGCDVASLTFELQVHEDALANSDMEPILYEVCDDNMEFDGDPTDDMVEFDLFTQNPLVLDGQDPANYIVSYYLTQADADAATNALPQLYTNTVNPQVIVVRVDNDTMVDDGTGTMVDSSDCYATAEITLQVNPMPSFDLEDSYLLCINTNGTEVIDSPTVDTGLSAADGYTFVWYLDGVEQPQYADMGSITPTEGGTYSVVVTSAQGCSTIVGDPNTVTVVEVSEPPVVSAEVTTLAFADQHDIQVTATTTATNTIAQYEFSLDGGPWESNTPNDGTYTFTNVAAGEHVITVRDVNGCGETSITITVMDYPHYFTPNGDGYHDTWNIFGIKDQPDAVIYIFDRYGKLLKQLSPTGEGWNGTYNGNPMPNSTYWFTVDYREPNTDQKKTFKAHFALKR